MTSLALSCVRADLVGQKSSLEFQQMVYSNQLNDLTSKLAQLSESGADMDSSPVRALEEWQKLYEQKQASIESQLKSINEQITNYGKAIDTNIKNDFKLSLTA